MQTDPRNQKHFWRRLEIKSIRLSCFSSFRGGDFLDVAVWIVLENMLRRNDRERETNQSPTEFLDYWSLRFDTMILGSAYAASYFCLKKKREIFGKKRASKKRKVKANEKRLLCQSRRSFLEKFSPERKTNHAWQTAIAFISTIRKFIVA